MLKDMRIALIGQSAFGESVLNALVQRGENIIAVCCPLDLAGERVDPVKLAGLKHNLPVLQYKRMRNRDAIDAFGSLNLDLCVMAFVTDIIPDAILKAPKKGSIQYHPSLLPRHRGPSSINWPIIQGETITGLTIFWPDQGLDTGPVLLQKETVIGPDDTLGSLYFDKLFPMGVEAMVEAVEMVRQGTAPRIVQDESQATYEGWCKAKDTIIDWSSTGRDIYNLIRGTDPSPGASTSLGRQKIQFYRTTLGADEYVESPGTVTEVSDNGFRVSVCGGNLFVQRVQPERSRKVMASEWARSVGLRPGIRFGG